MNPNLPYTLAQLNEPSDPLGVWYVYYFYEYPDKPGRKQFIIKKGINRLKTATEKRRYGAKIISIQNDLLKNGYSPFGGMSEKHLPLIEVCEQMYLLKKTTLRRRSWQSYKYSVDLLTTFLKKEKLTHILPGEFDKFLCRKFCDYILYEKKLSGVTFNHHRGNLGTIFIMMVDRDIILSNPFRKIPKEKEVVTRNAAFSAKELKEVNDYLILHNYRLYLFTQFIYFCFLRPVEILRLKVENVNLKERKIIIYGSQAKNKMQEMVEIPDAFVPLVKGMRLNEYPKDFFLFGRGLVPCETSLSRNRVSENFKEVKKALKMDKDQSLYGFKHSGVVAAFKRKIPIHAIMRQCRHHSIAETENYMRSLGLIRNTEFSSKMK